MYEDFFSHVKGSTTNLVAFGCCMRNADFSGSDPETWFAKLKIGLLQQGGYRGSRQVFHNSEKSQREAIILAPGNQRKVRENGNEKSAPGPS